MVKENVVYTYNRIQLLNIKEQTTDTHSDMHESQKYAEPKKPDTKFTYYTAPFNMKFAYSQTSL